ncbi:MAG: aminoglycoside phosphotransferase family protein [Clostridia bacterium]|nr:aminoglycoside phosphotransferase family protein [Clostridia bacterium]
MDDRLRRYVTLPRYREALALPPQQTEVYEPLAQGEYNKNFVFTHPVTGKRLVFRVNYGSQMHLSDQIGYEAAALKQLEPSGRTPKVWYVDGSLTDLDHGVLVMDWLPGRALDYERPEELAEAAAILADIHCVPVTKPEELIAPENSLRAILEECEAMVKVYMDSPLAPESKKQKIRTLLDLAWEKENDLQGKPFQRCIINTELNNTNFLMDREGRSSLVDWEKPLYGDPAQDLGHFLAPTTTFWKTDIIFSKEQIDGVLEAYIAAVEKQETPIDLSGIRERTENFLQVTCLRGITWCAMAWVEYQDPERALTNESTRKKLDQYLEDSFLDRIASYVE